jgi:hypothetical protein
MSLHILFRIKRIFSLRRPRPRQVAGDPFSHPDIQRMSPHQLSDLPFERSP